MSNDPNSDAKPDAGPDAGPDADRVIDTGYADVNGLKMYWERRGAADGVPLVVAHGGFGVTSMFGAVLDRLATDRPVIAIELQGHGHTADIDRPFSYEAFGDDLATLIEELGFEQADLLGYSLGGGSALRAAIQHPARVRRLVVVSSPFRRDAWFPEARAGMDQMSSAGFEHLRQTPMYAAYVAVAPDPDGFPALMDKTGDLLRRPYDWTEDVRTLTMPTMYVMGDADSFSPGHGVELFALLGGGLTDAGWDGTRPTPHRLAVLPATSHYDIFDAPALTDAVAPFLAD